MPSRASAGFWKIPRPSFGARDDHPDVQPFGDRLLCPGGAVPQVLNITWTRARRPSTAPLARYGVVASADDARLSRVFVFKMECPGTGTLRMFNIPTRCGPVCVPRPFGLIPMAIEFQFLRGRDLLKAGKATDAVEVLGKIIQSGPTSERNLTLYASALLAAGRAQDAVAAYEQALKLNPTGVDLRLDTARACLAAGRKERAFELRDALFREIPPGDPRFAYVLCEAADLLSEADSVAAREEACRSGENNCCSSTTR